MKSRMLTVLVTVIVTASLMLVMGPARSATPVLGAGADKIAVSAATDTIINQDQLGNPNDGVTAQLASTTFSTSTTEDLIVNFSTECGIYTAVGGKNGGTNTTGVTTSSTATGQVLVWIQLDNKMLPVSNIAPAGTVQRPNGPVSYCSRTLNLSTANLSPSQLIQISETTLDANSFQWFALNVGNGSHTLTVNATLVATTATGGTGGGTGSCDLNVDPTCFYTTPASSAIVGQRTLEVFPDHLSNTANF
jgi:hypothetical protein